MEMNREEQKGTLRVRIGESGLANRFALEARTAAHRAEKARDAAEKACESAEAGKSKAAASAQAAAESAGDAARMKTAAETAREGAESAKTLAEDAAREIGQSVESAAQAAQTAQNAQQGAETARDQTLTAASEAAQAKSAVQELKQSAETARDQAAASAVRAGQSAAALQDAETAARESAAAAAASAQRAEALCQSVDPVYNVRHYGAKWDKTNTALIRTGDAAGITTDTTNFAHRGSVNVNYSNPFDKIYPWSGCRLCNIDVDEYRALPAGADLRECVCAWEGDPAFSYSHPCGVWKYRPAFWGKSWDGEDGCRYFDISDRDCGSYIYYRAEITGRWRGVKTTLTIDGEEKPVLLPLPGIPCTRVKLDVLHGCAKNWGATLDDIYSWDGSVLMAIIEYASMNLQSALGMGVSKMRLSSSGQKFTANSTDSRVVHIADKSAAREDIQPGSVLNLGSRYYNEGGSRIVVDKEIGSGEILLTLDEPVTVTTDMFWNVSGCANRSDEQIGSRSGYIGSNGHCDCYYRGEVLWGNYWNYLLGALREASGGNQGRIWLARRGATDLAITEGGRTVPAAGYFDSGVTLTDTEGYVTQLGYPARSGLLAAFGICTQGSGSDSVNRTAPVGDYVYIRSTQYVQPLFAGGSAQGEEKAGPFSCDWRFAAYNWDNMDSTNWSYAARPRLKAP